MLNVVRTWILLSTLLVGAGWVLSACHQLNRTGYGIIFALAAVAVFLCREKIQWPTGKNFVRALHKFPRRFKRAAPLLFLALAMMSLVAGALYISGDGDSYGYRIPRVLHWLGQQRWHWIRTLDDRMNIVDCGFEWLSAPLILFTNSDRFIFLINWVSYLMLPGLIFSVFTRLGVRPRVAWWWMWLLASGWCYVLQADTTHNDSFPVIYALASVDLALRAFEKQRVSDLWLSLLSAALLTGMKQTLIPLVALWLVAAWPTARWLLARPLATIGVLAAGLVVSAAPLTFFNLEHTGSWTGISAHLAPASQLWGTSAASPFWGVIGNAFCLPVENLLPPFFPWADAWNGAMHRFLQTPFGAHFRFFQSFGYLSRAIHDGSAGIGLGICVLVLISLWAMFRQKRMAPAGGASTFGKLNRRLQLLQIIPWLLLVVFMAKVCTSNPARLMAPYYVFFFPPLLISAAHSRLVRQRWWQRLALLVMLVTAMLVVLSRSRPLFPAQTLMAWLQTRHPQSKLLSEARAAYDFRSSFDKVRYAFKNTLPRDEKVVGYVTGAGGAEVGLWLPLLGQREVERILPADTPNQLRRAGIHYVVIDEAGLQMRNESIGQWLARNDGTLADQMSYHDDPDGPQLDLYLVHLNPTEPDAK